MHQNSDLDNVYESDRAAGSTPPEPGDASGNIVGRPAGENDRAGAFHEPAETDALERQAFSGDAAEAAGGSYDGLGVPAAIAPDGVASGPE